MSALETAHAAGKQLYGASRTPFVLGAIALTFALYIILRGDLQRYSNILIGPVTQPQAQAQ